MGYGFPAAIGAQIALPESTVFCIAGDGSFQMNIQELATAANYKIPVKVAIINNGYLGGWFDNGRSCSLRKVFQHDLIG